jgi:hypothetical protein
MGDLPPMIDYTKKNKDLDLNELLKCISSIVRGDSIIKNDSTPQEVIVSLFLL